MHSLASNIGKDLYGQSVTSEPSVGGGGCVWMRPDKCNKAISVELNLTETGSGTEQGNTK